MQRSARTSEQRRRICTAAAPCRKRSTLRPIAPLPPPGRRRVRRRRNSTSQATGAKSRCHGGRTIWRKEGVIWRGSSCTSGRMANVAAAIACFLPGTFPLSTQRSAASVRRAALHVPGDWARLLKKSS